MKLRLLLFLTVFASLFCYDAQAQTTIEQWTFDGANPEAGINGMTQTQWTTTAPNSVPSAGVLRYATDDNGNSAQFPDGAISTSTISSLTLTIELTDMNLGDQIVFQFGEDGTGNMEVEFNEFSANAFSLDVEGNGSTLSPAAILNQNDFAGAIPLVVAVTWDFENNEMRYTVTGSATDSQSIAADLSGITSITSFRPRGGDMSVSGTYLDLDTITIETVAGPTTWTGATDSDWATASNWSSNAVPTATDDVVIPEVTNAPVVGGTTTAVCNDLTITETDGVTVSYGGSITVNGTSSGAINYVNYQLVPNGDFSNTADDLGSDGDTGGADWRFQANVDAVATGDIFEEAGNNVFRAVVTTVPSAAFNLRLRQEDVVCPATATKVIFRAKGSVDAMSIKAQFDGDGADKPSSTKSLTTSWAYYELDLPASSQGQTNRLQFQLLSTGTYYIDDVAFEYPVTWTGTTDSDWATASNWVTGVGPIATDDVLIPEVTTAPIIGASTAAVCNNLTVTETDGLTINAGGSLIVNGTSSGNVTYNRSLNFVSGNDNGWHLVSSPVAGETFDNAFATANSIASGTGSNLGVSTYTTAGNGWTYLQSPSGSISATSGMGYSMKRSATGTVAFTGTLNTDDVNGVAVATDDGGFNLLGNPYTAYMSSQTFLTANENTTGQIWTWAEGTGFTARTAAENFIIAPGQGFFVSVTNGSTVDFAESNQASGTDNFQKSGKTEINLTLNSGKLKRTAKLMYLDANVTKGFDWGFDGKTFTGLKTNMELYTNLLEDNIGDKYQVQSLPKNDMESFVIPLGFKASAGEITIAAEALNLPTGLKVFLEDTDTNTFIELTNSTGHKVTLNEAVDDVGRFYIHTKANSVLSTETVSLDNISVYPTSASNLRVTGLSQGKAIVKLYNILGKQVLNTSFISNGVQDITLPKLTSGIYIVQLENENGTLNKKIVLE